ncbi:hypothetical protein VTI74DRAFT_3260 [Chaetomium olivicolor]
MRLIKGDGWLRCIIGLSHQPPVYREACMTTEGIHLRRPAYHSPGVCLPGRSLAYQAEARKRQLHLHPPDMSSSTADRRIAERPELGDHDRKHSKPPLSRDETVSPLWGDKGAESDCPRLAVSQPVAFFRFALATVPATVHAIKVRSKHSSVL